LSSPLSGRPETRRDWIFRKIGQLAPSGAYAITIVHGGGQAEIHCAFANEADGTAFATAMDAQVVGRYSGYASQRLFRFDHAAASALEGALPPPPRLSAKRSQRDRLETAVKSQRLA